MSSTIIRSMAIALTLLAGGTMGACGKSNRGPVRVVVIGSDHGLADPAAGPLSAAQAVLLSNSAQGLVRFDARGQIVPGLAERWTVTDDGLSLIFRLASTEWPDGRKVTAQQVAKILRQQIASRSRNELKDSVGAISEIVAMTDRVIEIRLMSPRPNMLQLLAQPEFAILRDGEATGPFKVSTGEKKDSPIELKYTEIRPNDEEAVREQVVLESAEAPVAVREFIARKADLVLGGTFTDLPYVRTPDIPRGTLKFDPASGLFGLVPVRKGGMLADPEVRRLLSQALDRQSLVGTLDVPGLLPRSTILEPGLDFLPDPVAQDWEATPIAERRQALGAASAELFAGAEEQPILRIALPEGPGAQLLLNRLAADWGAIGIKVERAGPGKPADLELIDRVAPSTSPAWFLRQFRCEAAAICDEQADELLEAARAAPIAAQRYALLAEAARLMDEDQLFIPIAAPIRWSLVSNRAPGFAGNRFARHTLIGLGESLAPERAD